MNNDRMPKIMLNYRPSGRIQLGRPLRRLLDETETGLSRPNPWRIIIIIVIIIILFGGKIDPSLQACVFRSRCCLHWKK